MAWRPANATSCSRRLKKKWIVADDEGTEPLLGDCCKRRVDFALAAGVKDINVKPERASGHLQLFGLGIGTLAGGIQERGHCLELR